MSNTVPSRSSCRFELASLSMMEMHVYSSTPHFRHCLLLVSSSFRWMLAFQVVVELCTLWVSNHDDDCIPEFSCCVLDTQHESLQKQQRTGGSGKCYPFQLIHCHCESQDKVDTVCIAHQAWLFFRKNEINILEEGSYLVRGLILLLIHQK